MDEQQMDKERAFMEAMGYCHLYHQQHVIDEYKISHEEYVSRMAAQGLTAASLATMMSENADRLNADEHMKSIFQRAIDLF